MLPGLALGADLTGEGQSPSRLAGLDLGSTVQIDCKFHICCGAKTLSDPCGGDPMKRTLWLAVSAFLLCAGEAKAAPWTRAFVVDWLEPAFFHDGPENENIAPGSDCPDGTAI